MSTSYGNNLGRSGGSHSNSMLNTAKSHPERQMYSKVLWALTSRSQNAGIIKAIEILLC